MKSSDPKTFLALAFGLAIVASPTLAQQTAGGSPAGGPAGTTGAGSNQAHTEGGYEKHGDKDKKDGKPGDRASARGLEMGKGHDKHASHYDWERWDRDQDRRISAREGRGLYPSFAAWDADHDRALRIEEFHTGLYTTLDADASGTIDRDEFVVLDRWGFRNANDLALWDLDRDGFIERNEFDRTVVGVSVYPAWDLDRDGRLMVDEFDTGYFAMWDLDRDGYLVREEFEPIVSLHDKRDAGVRVGSTMPTTTMGLVDGEYVTISIPVSAVSVDLISADPVDYFGDTVAVEGEVEQKVGPHVYAIEADGDGADQDLIVLVPEQVGTLPVGTDVKVVGQIRPLVRAELERDFDWFDASWVRRLDRSFDRRQPVLIASAILTEDGRSLFPMQR